MRSRMLRVFLLVLSTVVEPSGTLAASAGPSKASSTNKYRLKPGASGEVCLECHSGDVEAQLKRPFVHTPVKAKDCIGCHSPHASAHGKLLAAEPDKICASCHSSVVPDNPKSSHRPAAEGRCTKCHEAHAATYPNNLVTSPALLCASCHQEIAEGATKAHFKHAPLEQGCTICHDPHGSSVGPALLKKNVPELCVGCHKVTRPIFSSKHMNYPVGNSLCTSCHDPHGSDVRGILYGTVHSPVARGLCSQCHASASSPKPFQTKQTGLVLCKGCHLQELNGMLEQDRVHWPLVAGAACLNCHSPHASRQKALLKGAMATVCGTCHSDTVMRQERSPTKHPPVQAGECTGCHDPHGSRAPFMFKKLNRAELCGACHDWQNHANHPMGAGYQDPRNLNLQLDCLSCHRAHGTEYEHMLPYSTTTELCTKCHTNLKR